MPKKQVIKKDVISMAEEKNMIIELVKPLISQKELIEEFHRKNSFPALGRTEGVLNAAKILCLEIIEKAIDNVEKQREIAKKVIHELLERQRITAFVALRDIKEDGFSNLSVPYLKNSSAVINLVVMYFEMDIYQANYLSELARKEGNDEAVKYFVSVFWEDLKPVFQETIIKSYKKNEKENADHLLWTQNTIENYLNE